MSGRTYYERDDTHSAEGGLSDPLKFPDGNRVKVRACEGSSTDHDKYGCSAWAYATA